MPRTLTDAERWRRYAAGTAARALVRISVLVPEADADLIRRLAQRRRDRAQIAQPFRPEPEPTA